MFGAQSSVFVYAASAYSGKSVDKFNFDIREGVYVLNRKIRKAFDKLPFPDMVREGGNLFHLEVGEGVDHLDLEVGEGVDHLDLDVGVMRHHLDLAAELDAIVIAILGNSSCKAHGRNQQYEHCSN